MLSQSISSQSISSQSISSQSISSQSTESKSLSSSVPIPITSSQSVSDRESKSSQSLVDINVVPSPILLQQIVPDTEDDAFLKDVFDILQSKMERMYYKCKLRSNYENLYGIRLNAIEFHYENDSVHNAVAEPTKITCVNLFVYSKLHESSAMISYSEPGDCFNDFEKFSLFTKRMLEQFHKLFICQKCDHIITLGKDKLSEKEIENFFKENNPIHNKSMICLNCKLTSFLLIKTDPNLLFECTNCNIKLVKSERKKVECDGGDKHSDLCFDCYKKIYKQFKKCPTCRQEWKDAEIDAEMRDLTGAAVAFGNNIFSIEGGVISSSNEDSKEEAYIEEEALSMNDEVKIVSESTHTSESKRESQNIIPTILPNPIIPTLNLNDIRSKSNENRDDYDNIDMKDFCIIC